MQKQGACGSRFLLCKGRDQHRRGGAGQQAVFLSCRVGSLTGRKHTKAGLRRLWTLVSTMEWSESSYGVLSIILAEADENCHRLTLSMIGDFSISSSQHRSRWELGNSWGRGRKKHTFKQNLEKL